MMMSDALVSIVEGTKKTDSSPGARDGRIVAVNMCTTIGPWYPNAK
jgi:hypothetical protein